MSQVDKLSRRYGLDRNKAGLYVPIGRSALFGKVIRQRRGIIVTDDLGLLSERVITTAGVNYLASTFVNTVEPENFNFHASGTNNTAEATGDTALGTEVESRVSGTQSNPSANIYRTVATVTYTATRAIVEHGVFSASTSGTLWDRSVFPTVNVVSGDSIQFTYNLTLTAGG